jgi:hypothetical protein
MNSAREQPPNLTVRLLKGMTSVKKAISSISSITLLLLLASAAVMAQAPADTLSGKYEGTVKTAGAADAQATLELKNDGGKVSGKLVSGSSTLEISEGTLADGKLTLKFGAAAKDGLLNAKVEADKITGDWISGSQKKSVELKKVGAAAAAPAAAFDINGQWEAVADAQGQPFPFTLVLKVEGESVSGSSSSQLGESKIKTGSWKDGKLAFELEGQNGTITMSAEVVEGKLAGQFDFAGQLSGKWVAVKKTN